MLLASPFPHPNLQDRAQGLPLTSHAPLPGCHHCPPPPGLSNSLSPQPEPHSCCGEGAGLMLQSNQEQASVTMCYLE